MMPLSENLLRDLLKSTYDRSPETETGSANDETLSTTSFDVAGDSFGLIGAVSQFHKKSVCFLTNQMFCSLPLFPPLINRLSWF
jgi:hypothetical protein